MHKINFVINKIKLVFLITCSLFIDNLKCMFTKFVHVGLTNCKMCVNNLKFLIKMNNKRVLINLLYLYIYNCNIILVFLSAKHLTKQKVNCKTFLGFACNILFTSLVHNFLLSAKVCALCLTQKVNWRSDVGRKWKHFDSEVTFFFILLLHYFLLSANNCALSLIQ